MQDPIKHHQLRVARKTMTLSCVGLSILGGPNHKEASEIIKKLTGKAIAAPEDCTCGAVVAFSCPYCAREYCDELERRCTSDDCSQKPVDK